MAQTVSTLVANTIANSRVINPAGATKGVLMVMADTVTVPDTANADTIILAPIPVSCIIRDIELEIADLGSAGTIDVGLFQQVTVGDSIVFVAVDKDCIANDLDVTPAFSSMISAQRMAGLAADTVLAKAHEIAGLPEKPAYAQLFIGLTTDVGTTIAGTASIKVTFTE